MILEDDINDEFWPFHNINKTDANAIAQDSRIGEFLVDVELTAIAPRVVLAHRRAHFATQERKSRQWRRTVFPRMRDHRRGHDPQSLGRAFRQEILPGAILRSGK